MNRLVQGRNPRKGHSLAEENTHESASITTYNKNSTTMYPEDDTTEMDDGYCRRTEMERNGRKSAVQGIILESKKEMVNCAIAEK